MPTSNSVSIAMKRAVSAALLGGAAMAGLHAVGVATSLAADAPRPLLAKDHQVDWWFVFKFNSSKGFAGCGPTDEEDRTCMFGGKPQTKPSFGQQFAFASSDGLDLKQGAGCLGATLGDPVGATFNQVWSKSYFYVLWNDQFYGDPKVCGKSANCTGRWGHSKGMLAWNEAGEGFVMQVSTPSWPGSGSKLIDRKAGNTLGCIKTNNNLKASQHFFALKLSKDNLVKVLHALRVANVATDPSKLQVVHNGGPDDVQDLVNKLGDKPDTKTTAPFVEKLSADVTLIAKPSALFVPPWQMVSALMEGMPERAATWWTKPWIYTTTKARPKVGCWNEELESPGPVAIALTGTWDGKEIKLSAPSNHAKIGTAVSGNDKYAIFGDMNQQGSASPPANCKASQNGRGGLFFVVKNAKLHDRLSELIDGETAKTSGKK